jgi:hypothetical protein
MMSSCALLLDPDRSLAPTLLSSRVLAERLVHPAGGN